MISTSQRYKDAIYSPSRKTAGKVVFQIVDTTAQADASDTVTGEATISKKDQVFNTNTDLSAKYATFENNYWKLDGSFVLPPKASEPGYEVGWWSAALCGADGTFGVPQVLTINFTTDHSSIGLTIYFDTQTNEYASDFTIQVYNSSNALIYSISVTGNLLSKYILEHTIANYRKIVVTVTKWATGYRRARIAEVSFGVVYDYTGDDLITVNVLEEMDTLSSQVTSNELKYTLDNQDKRFNLINPVGVYPALQRKQKILPYIGVEKVDTSIEYVPMGVFFLTEWKSDEGALTASFTARDILDIMAQDTYAGATFTAQTVYAIAVVVLNAAGITNYYVDPALLGITVSGTIGKVNYREAIQTVAIVGMAVVYSDRTGKVIVKQLGNTASSEIIDFDNVYSPPEIKLNTLINTVYITISGVKYAYVDASKPVGEQTLSVDATNTLITNTTIAANVAAWILTEYKKRFLYAINWRGNPALECGDIVTVEDDFSENKTVRITKQDITFAGYLGGKTSGKGGG